MKPLLSICIPTYNRAEMLRDALECLAAEIAPFGDEVELIVSDNCSTDHTREVVEEASKKCKIRYNRNNANLGCAGNIKILVEELATGEFCWLVGDDDIVRKGAIEKVLSVIKAHPDLDYIFMNMSYESDRSKIKQIFEHVVISSHVSWPIEDRILDRWEDIIGMAKQMYPFTQMTCHIFRRSNWQTLSISDYSPWSSLAAVYPHIVGIAPMMVGKPCYYIGHPYVGFFVNQDWKNIWWPKIVVVYTLEVTDLLEKLGATKSSVDKYRNMIFRHGSHQFSDIITKKKPGRESVSLKSIFKRYCMYPEFWLLIFRLTANKIWGVFFKNELNRKNFQSEIRKFILKVKKILFFNPKPKGSQNVS